MPPPEGEQEDRREQLRALDYLVHEHPVIEVLGLSAVTMEALGGGFAPRGTMLGRVCIPLRMEDGTLVGYLGIATREDMAPLLQFPKNLEKRCLDTLNGDATPDAEPEQKPEPDNLRKLFRVVS